MTEPDSGAVAPGGAEPVTPIRTLVRVWVALLALTALTVGVSRLDLGPLHTLLPLAIAAGKCALVLCVFMRLRHEPRFFTVMLLIAVVTLAVFIGLIFFDVSFR